MERFISVAAATPVCAHFCDYATGTRLLAANHKNDTDSCAILATALHRSQKETEWVRGSKRLKRMSDGMTSCNGS